jgi:hypothetical protein
LKILENEEIGMLWDEVAQTAGAVRPLYLASLQDEENA